MAISKLSENQISEIKKMLDNGVNQKTIAFKYEITQADVSFIKNDKHLEKTDYTKLYVSNVSNTKKELLDNIAKNKGYKGYPELLKYHINKLIEEAPDHLKKKPLLD